MTTCDNCTHTVELEGQQYCDRCEKAAAEARDDYPEPEEEEV